MQVRRRQARYAGVEDYLLYVTYGEASGRVRRHAHEAVKHIAPFTSSLAHAYAIRTERYGSIASARKPLFEGHHESKRTCLNCLSINLLNKPGVVPHSGKNRNPVGASLDCNKSCALKLFFWCDFAD